MARIRTIRPEFFRHEGLQELEARFPKNRPMLVYAGLWCLCDSHGRFEWKPRSIKLDVLPFVKFDIEKTLELLEQSGFIGRYEVNNRSYGLVYRFREHQRFAGKEVHLPPKYPDPPLGKQSGSIGEVPGKQLGIQGIRNKEYEIRNKKYGEEPATESPSPSLLPILTIPLKTGKEYPVTQTDVDEWQATYPNIDVKGVLLQIRQWNIDNFSKRKTQGGVRAHINRWLKSENDRAGIIKVGDQETLYREAAQVLRIDGEANFKIFLEQNSLNEAEAQKWII